jgi:hypothetical protein
MPTRNIGLTPEHKRRRKDTLRLKVLRTKITAGVDALEAGDFVEVDAQDLDGYLNGLVATPRTNLLPETPSIKT